MCFGGSIDVEAHENIDRVHDALNATRSAVEEGFVVTIANNADINGAIVVAKFASKEYDWSYGCSQCCFSLDHS